MGYTREQREANAKKKAEQAALLKAEEENIKDDEVVKNNDTQNKILATRKTKKNLPLNTLVEVKNGFNGKLIYKSLKTIGLTIVFEKFGDSDFIELGELVSARNSARKFFENNWFLIDDYEIIEFLGVQKYYENAFNTETFDTIFEKTPNEIDKIVKKMSKGQKNTLIYRAMEFIDNGKIDSRNTIAALEKALEVQLIEQ